MSEIQMEPYKDFVDAYQDNASKEFKPKAKNLIRTELEEAHALAAEKLKAALDSGEPKFEVIHQLACTVLAYLMRGHMRLHREYSYDHGLEIKLGAENAYSTYAGKKVTALNSTSAGIAIGGATISLISLVSGWNPAMAQGLATAAQPLSSGIYNISQTFHEGDTGSRFMYQIHIDNSKHFRDRTESEERRGGQIAESCAHAVREAISKSNQAVQAVFA